MKREIDRNKRGNMDLTESLEDYLEAIYVHLQEKKVVRVKDLMKHFNYKSSSVNTAVGQLKKKGLVDHEKYGYIDLTTEGREPGEGNLPQARKVNRLPAGHPRDKRRNCGE